MYGFVFQKKRQHKNPKKAPESNLYGFVKKSFLKRSSISIPSMTFVYPPASWSLLIYSSCQLFQAFLICVFKSIGLNFWLFLLVLIVYYQHTYGNSWMLIPMPIFLNDFPSRILGLPLCAQPSEILSSLGLHQNNFQSICSGMIIEVYPAGSQIEGFLPPIQEQ